MVESAGVALLREAKKPKEMATAFDFEIILK